MSEQIIYATPAGEGINDAIAADPSGVLLCVDFDGTLSPIVNDPSDARAYPGAIDALVALAARLGRVAVITGRDVATVVRLSGLGELPPVEHLTALGQYGVERWDSATGEFAIPEPPAAVAQAKQEIVDLIERTRAAGTDTAGLRIEDKGRAIGVHTRQAANPDALLNQLTPELLEIAKRHGLTSEPGRNVLELRASQVNKGDGMQSLIDEVSPRVIVMAGDDLGDLAAFDVVDAWQAAGKIGATVASRSDEQPTVAARADVVCEGPAGVTAWLQELVVRLN